MKLAGKRAGLIRGGRHMLVEVEYLRLTEEAPEGELLRRVVGAFADLKAAEQEALRQASSIEPMADGFRIYSDGVLSKTVRFTLTASNRLAL